MSKIDKSLRELDKSLRQSLISQPEKKKSIKQLERSDLYYWINSVIKTQREDYKTAQLTLITFGKTFQDYMVEFVTDAKFNEIIKRIKELNK